MFSGSGRACAVKSAKRRPARHDRAGYFLAGPKYRSLRPDGVEEDRQDGTDDQGCAMEGSEEAMPALRRSPRDGQGDGPEPAVPDQEHPVAASALETASGSLGQRDVRQEGRTECKAWEQSRQADAPGR